MITVAVVSDVPLASGVLHGTHEAARLVPFDDASPDKPVDVALVDGYAATRTSIEVASRLAQSGCARAVVLHALHITPDLVAAARRAHLAGVVGRQVFGPALVDTLIEIAVGDCTESPVVVESPEHALSPQEREILILIGQGYSNDEIGLELDVSVNTVKSSVRTLYRKLGVRNRTGAAMLSHRHADASIDHPVVVSGESRPWLPVV